MALVRQRPFNISDIRSSYESPCRSTASAIWWRLGSVGSLTSVRERDMFWTAPVIVEVCIGMEITSYVSAEI